MGLRLDPMRDFLLGKKKGNWFKKSFLLHTAGFKLLFLGFHKGFPIPFFFLEELSGSSGWKTANPCHGTPYFPLGPGHHPGKMTKPMDLGLHYGNMHPAGEKWV